MPEGGQVGGARMRTGGRCLEGDRWEVPEWGQVGGDMWELPEGDRWEVPGGGQVGGA